MTMGKYSVHKVLPFVVALCALCLMPGCRTVSDWFTEPIVLNANGWIPLLPDDTRITDPRHPMFDPIRKSDGIRVTIYVNGSPVVNWDGIVDVNGNIMLLYLGNFYIENQTPNEAEISIKRAYEESKIYINPHVTVFLPKRPDQEVIYLTGHVNRVGPHPFRDGMTLLQAIIGAGDVSVMGGSKVVVYRGGIPTTYNIRDIRRGTAVDPLLRPDDRISVLESGWFD